MPDVLEPDKPKPVKNIIFCMGDGMGISQIALARYYSTFVEVEELNMTRIMNRGSTAYMTTHSANSLVTDSAAAATAMVTGFKTYCGMVSMTPDGIPRVTILQKAQRMGKSTGIVSDTRLSHATPAAFTVHHACRWKENEIAVDILKQDVTVLLGGGWRHFVPQHVEGSKREDNRDLLREAKAAGYTVVRNAEEFKRVDPKVTDKLLGALLCPI